MRIHSINELTDGVVIDTSVVRKRSISYECIQLSKCVFLFLRQLRICVLLAIIEAKHIERQEGGTCHIVGAGAVISSVAGKANLGNALSTFTVQSCPSFTK